MKRHTRSRFQMEITKNIFGKNHLLVSYSIKNSTDLCSIEQINI
jgi:hypothetical protein